MTNELFKIADRLKELKDTKKSLEAEVKAVNAEIEKLDAALSDAMLSEECERFSHNGSLFHLTTRLYASPVAGHKDELFEALRANGLGDIITETVNANTLASVVSEQKHENDGEIPAWLAGVVNAYEKTSVGIRKG